MLIKNTADQLLYDSEWMKKYDLLYNLTSNTTHPHHNKNKFLIMESNESWIKKHYGLGLYWLDIDLLSLIKW